ncbi:MAG: hypothetical protein AB1696_16380 [Planctomycetota bacterium]
MKVRGIQATLWMLLAVGLCYGDKKSGGTALDESFKGARLNAAEKDVIAAFGPAESEKQYSGTLVTHSLAYPKHGLLFYITDQGQVRSIQITAPEWRLKSGIRVGDSLRKVFHAYGKYKAEILGPINQTPKEYPTLVHNPDTGDQVIRYDTGYAFWADRSGRIKTIRLSLEYMKRASEGGLAERAPDFSVTDSRGVAISLSDYRGRPVLLLFGTTW